MTKLPLLAGLGAVVTLLGSPPAPKPLAQGAIDYYDTACTHCHGPYGSAYGEGFFKKYDLTQLTKSVKEMAEGPGQHPLADDGLDAQVAFHQAIIAHLPFIDWTGQDGTTLSGEVTKKAKLTATLDDKPLDVKVDDTDWEIHLPAGADLSKLSLKAELNGKAVTWKPEKHPFSLPPKWPPLDAMNK